MPQLKDDKSLHFLFLPEQHDPDSYIRAHGKTEFEDALLHQSKPLSEYFWDALSENLNLRTQEGKSQLVKASAPLLAQISAPALGFLLKQQLGELVGIDPANLAQLLGQEAPKRDSRQKSYKLPKETFRQPQMPTLAQKQIRALLLHPAWVVHVQLPDYLPLTGDAACLATLAETIRNSSAAEPTGAQILEQLRGSEYENALFDILRNSEATTEPDDHSEESETEFLHGMQRLLREFKTTQIDALKTKHSQSGLSAEEQRLLLSLLTGR